MTDLRTAINESLADIDIEHLRGLNSDGKVVHLADHLHDRLAKFLRDQPISSNTADLIAEVERRTGNKVALVKRPSAERTQALADRIAEALPYIPASWVEGNLIRETAELIANHINGNIPITVFTETPLDPESEEMAQAYALPTFMDHDAVIDGTWSAPGHCSGCWVDDDYVPWDVAERNGHSFGSPPVDPLVTDRIAQYAAAGSRTPFADAIYEAFETAPVDDIVTKVAARELAEHVARHIAGKQIDTLSEAELITALENRSGFKVLLVQQDHNTLVYDPATEGAVTLPRNFCGIAIADGVEVLTLDDTHAGQVHIDGPIQRAVIIARLRAWADALEKGADQ